MAHPRLAQKMKELESLHKFNIIRLKFYCHALTTKLIKEDLMQFTARLKASLCFRITVFIKFPLVLDLPQVYFVICNKSDTVNNPFPNFPFPNFFY